MWPTVRDQTVVQFTKHVQKRQRIYFNTADPLNNRKIKESAKEWKVDMPNSNSQISKVKYVVIYGHLFEL